MTKRAEKFTTYCWDFHLIEIRCYFDEHNQNKFANFLLLTGASSENQYLNLSLSLDYISYFFSLSLSVVTRMSQCVPKSLIPLQFFPSPKYPVGQGSHVIVFVIWMQRTPGKQASLEQFRMTLPQCCPLNPTLQWQV